MTVFGDGSQTRSFCYVSDLVDGLYRLMLSDERYPVNLGNPREMTILEFAEHIRAVTGQPVADRIPAVAGGRSQEAQAGYYACPAVAGLGAAGGVGRRLKTDNRVLSRSARYRCVKLVTSVTEVPH